jgi:hypothetical protein
MSFVQQSQQTPKDLADLLAILRSSGLTPQLSEWQIITSYLNSWAHHASGREPQYAIDTLGFVHLRGLIKDGTVGSDAFTLPTGYRPAERERFAIVADSAFGRLDVLDTGGVRPLSPSSNTWVSLDGIIFEVA